MEVISAFMQRIGRQQERMVLAANQAASCDLAPCVDGLCILKHPSGAAGDQVVEIKPFGSLGPDERMH